MRAPGLAMLVAVTTLALGHRALADAPALRHQPAAHAVSAGEAGALHRIADEASAPVEDKGNSGWLAGLTAGGLGCLLCSGPSVAIGAGCMSLFGSCLICPGTLLGFTAFAAAGAGLASMIDGAGLDFGRLLAPIIVGAAVGGVTGVLAGAVALGVSFATGFGLASLSGNPTSPDTLRTAENTGRVSAAVVFGTTTLVGAIATGIGTAIAYGMAASSDEPAQPSELDATPPAEPATPPVDQPQPEDSQPAPAETQPPPAEQPAADDPDMKGFFY